MSIYSCQIGRVSLENGAILLLGVMYNAMTVFCDLKRVLKPVKGPLKWRIEND